MIRSQVHGLLRGRCFVIVLIAILTIAVFGEVQADAFVVKCPDSLEARLAALEPVPSAIERSDGWVVSATIAESPAPVWQEKRADHPRKNETWITCRTKHAGLDIEAKLVVKEAFCEFDAAADLFL